MTPNDPLVSVITIFLNAEKFIDEAIGSVVAQTYGRCELLLVDDGSTDASTAVAQDWANRRPGQVRYLQHPGHENRGMSASRNLGVKHARGDYIAFVDADDVWLPSKLEQQVALLESHARAAMVYGRTEIWFSWTGKAEDRTRDFSYPLGVPPNALVESPTLILLLLENKFQTPTTCSALIRRNAYQEVGGFQEAFRGIFEDQAFFLKLCLREPVFVSNQCWARYRQHSESCCAVAERSGRSDAARLPLLRWFQGYLVEQGVEHQQVWKALRHELWPYEHPALSYLLNQAQAFRRKLRTCARAAHRSISRTASRK